MYLEGKRLEELSDLSFIIVMTQYEESFLLWPCLDDSFLVVLVRPYKLFVILIFIDMYNSFDLPD